jgi:regulator of replication initiation timing
MDSNENQSQLEERLNVLTEHLATIRRNTEKLMAENQRLREVVRLAETELRKRRDQVQQFEYELQDAHEKREDAKARVDHVIEKLDQIITQPEQEPS